MALPKFIVEREFVSTGKLTILSEDESHHAVRVRRLKQGQEVVLLDGDGMIATGTIQDANKRAVAILVDEVEIKERQGVALTVAIAMPKPEKSKGLLDMLVQLGVARIIPLITEFSNSKWTDKLADKSQKVMIEACKQSENLWLPKLREPMELEEVVERAQKQDADIYYGHMQAETVSFSPNKNAVLLIGPEGGFSESELAYLSSLSDEGRAVALQVGENILRTETAAVAASAVVLFQNVY